MSEERTAKDAAEALPYEEVVARLTHTVERLEKGELSLEEQIRAFEDGVALVRRGHALLDAAEKKVEQLLEDDRTAGFDAPGGEEG